MIRTKIIATMGPATADVEVLYRLFDAGVDVCRLNFSHGTLDGHKAMLDLIREAAKRFHHPVAVLGDLGGPKIRLGKIADVDGTGGMPIEVGEELSSSAIARRRQQARQLHLRQLHRRRAGRAPHPHRGRHAPLPLHREDVFRAALRLQGRRHHQEQQGHQPARLAGVGAVDHGP
jgi:hypothetical protein